MLGVCQEFPQFSLNAVDGSNNIIEVTNADLDGKWSVVYFYPKDFTFICPTEIAAMDKLLEEAAVLGISGDNEFCKLNWKQNNDIIKDIRHPLVADTGLILSEKLGIVDWNEGVCRRATFIVDQNKIIQHASENALDTGRNVDEVIRTLKALQSGGLTACSWNPGDDFVG